MRKIKFRLFLGNKFHYWGFLDKPICFAGPPTCNYDLLSIEEVEERTQQFTGLFDKNGKEIYEGDVWERDGYTGIVTFGYAQWCFVKTPNSNVYSYPAFYSNADAGVIIGNIYENPELLEDNVQA